MNWTQFWLLMSAIYLSNIIHPILALILGIVAFLMSLVDHYANGLKI
jgi:fumarate reductase subunit D